MSSSADSTNTNLTASAHVTVSVRLIPPSTSWIGTAIDFAEPDRSLSTVSEEQGTPEWGAAVWFHHNDTDPREITGISIARENFDMIPSNLEEVALTKIPLPFDKRSMETLNALGGYIAFAPTHFQKTIFRRIAELNELAIEDGICMSASSFWDLWSFVSNYSLTRVPSVFALDNGNFRAVWKNPEGEQIGLEFCGDQFVRFVIFGYSVPLGQMIRISGSQAVSQIRLHIEATFTSHLLTSGERRSHS